MDLIIASNNQHKVSEIKAILGDKFENVYTLKEKGINVEIEENGETFLENALIKAKTIAEMTNMVALADDSGLVVDALNGAPSIYSARYAGEPCDDEANNQKLLKNMENVSDDKRDAHFVSVVALFYPNKHYVWAEGKIEGTILHEYRGENGFGYDPLFYCYKLKKTFAEANSEEKNKVSHRAVALNKLKEQL